MSTGIIKQFVDFTTSGDTNQNEADAIEPVENGENVIATVTNRPPENLRVRSETIRGILEDLLYLVDADRHIFVGGPGTVTWPGAAPGQTGIFTLSDSVYIIPALTPGYAQTPPVPPVASAYGTLTLAKAGGAAGLILTSRRRSYAGGDRINVTVVEGTPLAVTTAVDGRTVTITTPSTATLDEVRVAINALTADTPATQLLTAVVDGGALGTDLIDSTQAQQFISGNYDGEGHTIVPANLATFFAADGGANVLKEGDSLCVWYAYLRDPAAPPTYGGRREAIPENTNTAIPAGSFFNSRVHPERLVDALPIAKVINGYLCFVSGLNVPLGATGVSFNNSTYNGGSAWYDGTTNPATTFEVQIDKIITDLIATTTAHSGADKLGCAARTDWLGGTTKANAAASLFAAINKIITDLALNAAATDDGSIRVGAAAVTDLAQGSVRSQLTTLAADWAKLARANTFTQAQTIYRALFTALVDTAANARTSRLQGDLYYGGATDYTLITEWIGNNPAYTKPIRIYALPGKLRITINARWDGTNWNQDTSSTGASSFVLSIVDGFRYEVKDNSTPVFTDVQWLPYISMESIDDDRGFVINAQTSFKSPTTETSPSTLHDFHYIGPDANGYHEGQIVSYGGAYNTGQTDVMNNLAHYQVLGTHFKEDFFKLDTDLWDTEADVAFLATVTYLYPDTGKRHVVKLRTANSQLGSHASICAPGNLMAWKREDYVAFQYRVMFSAFAGTVRFGLGDDVHSLSTGKWLVNWYLNANNVYVESQWGADIVTGITTLSTNTWYYFTIAYTPGPTTTFDLQWWVTSDADFYHSVFGVNGIRNEAAGAGGTFSGPACPKMTINGVNETDKDIYFDYVELWGRTRFN
jgi:hypothetical protein